MELLHGPDLEMASATAYGIRRKSFDVLHVGRMGVHSLLV